MRARTDRARGELVLAVAHILVRELAEVAHQLHHGGPRLHAGVASRAIAD